MKKLILTILISCALSVNVAAGELTVRQAGAQLGLLMEYILENYAGETRTAVELYTAAARGMTTPLDEFSEYMSADEYEQMYNSLSGNFKGIGIQFTERLDGSVVIVSVIEGSPAEKAGVLKADVIRKVNGKPVAGGSLSQMIAEQDGAIKLEVSRGDALKSFSLIKAGIHVSTVTYCKLSERVPDAAPHMGYINISQIGENTARETEAAVSSLKAGGVTQVVIDLRGNPGGLKSEIDDISQMLVPKGIVYSTINASGKKEVYRSELNTPPFKDVAVLVDGATASACELLASALQDAKAATIIGQMTFGKGIIQTFAEFPTGDMLKYTSMEYLRRNGERLHGIGITPDIIITKPRHVDEEMLVMNNDGTGAGVENCKRLLAYIGYDVDVSGERYDDKLRAAIMDIQKRAKLIPTGAFDLQTIKAVNTAYAEYVDEHDAELLAAYDLFVK